jgi:hypothetical protein
MSKQVPETVFDRIVATLHDVYGEGWSGDATENKNFAVGAQSVFHDADGIHLIGEPELEHGQMNFNLWIDTPVDDVLAADEIAFGLFAELADDLFVCSRQIEDRGIRYRFVTGNGNDGHLGSIHFVGPNAVAFVNLHRLRAGRSAEYHA